MADVSGGWGEKSSKNAQSPSRLVYTLLGAIFYS